jgi:hypothetical protein
LAGIGPSHSLTGTGRPGVDCRRRDGRRKGAAGSVTSPPPDRSGACPSRGPYPVSPRPGPGSTIPRATLASRLPPLLAQGLRALVPAAPAPGPLLSPRLPGRRTPLAPLAGRSPLSRHRPRPTAPLRPGPTLSRPSPPAIRYPSTRSSHAPGRADARRRRGSAAPRQRPGTPRRRPRRGPAPSGNPRNERRPALPSARLLCPVPPHATVPRSAILLGLLPAGFTPRPSARGRAPPPPAPGHPAATTPPSRPASTRLAHVVTY